VEWLLNQFGLRPSSFLSFSGALDFSIFWHLVVWSLFLSMWSRKDYKFKDLSPHQPLNLLFHITKEVSMPSESLFAKKV
jgi:hypothetical protein